jgi:hypothetical protein
MQHQLCLPARCECNYYAILCAGALMEARHQNCSQVASGERDHWLHHMNDTHILFLFTPREEVLVSPSAQNVLDNPKLRSLTERREHARLAVCRVPVQQRPLLPVSP